MHWWLLTLIVLGTLQLGPAYAYPVRDILRRDEPQDYFAPFTLSHISLESPTNSVNIAAIQTALESGGGPVAATSPETDGVQDKGVFSFIGKIFKSIFHIGESAATKALKKAMPVFKQSLKVRNALPAQRFHDSLTPAQKSSFMKVSQAHIKQNRKAYELLAQGGSSAAGVAGNIVARDVQNT